MNSRETFIFPNELSKPQLSSVVEVVRGKAHHFCSGNPDFFHKILTCYLEFFVKAICNLMLLSETRYNMIPGISINKLLKNGKKCMSYFQENHFKKG